ncbi:hypothetical protein, partial [uncultured Boseongicola sp.]|uniref:hypothetical protein n=1 Tax=uncultured Boseongicola sp. TaxID=1648499 RepID=UPI002622F81C
GAADVVGNASSDAACLGIGSVGEHKMKVVAHAFVPARKRSDDGLDKPSDKAHAGCVVQALRPGKLARI